jgi:AcrR family transcriptional regulator
MLSGMAKPTRTLRVPRNVQILQVSAALFAERGFASVGVDELGEAAGVTGPAIYRHFKGKDEILATLFDEAIDNLLVVTGGDFDDPFAELEHLVRGHAGFILRERNLASIFVREDRLLAEPYRKRLQRRQRRYIERWTGCLERCYPEQDGAVLTTATYAALGALNSMSTWPERARPEGDTVDTVVATVLGGLHAVGERSADAVA